MIEKHFDVAIIGSGPAGSTAAIRLSQLGLSTCIIDPIDVHRRKIGESLPGAITRLLKTLDIKGPESLLAKNHIQKCTANISSWSSDRWTYTDSILNPEGGGWHIIRHQFDNTLKKRALLNGVVTIDHRVERLEMSPGEKQCFKITVNNSNHSEITSTWLIDASGRANVLGRQLGVSRTHYGRQMAAYCWIKASANDREYATRIKSVINGWFYTALLPDQTRVISFQSLPQKVSKLIKDPQQLLNLFNQGQMIPYSVNMKDLDSDVQATMANVSKPHEITGAGWLLTGDAALSFDPLSSQGIFFSIYSAIKAAETIHSASNKPYMEKDLFCDYANVIQDIFIKNQNLRKYHYTSENRFTTHPYWQQYRMPEVSY